MAVTITSGDTINITVTQSASSSVTITSKGPKGDTGETGATGADGADGVGVPAGGVEGQVILMQSATDYDTEWDYVESVYAPIENNEGSVMSAGTPVYAKGISGNRILVGVADANDSAKMPAIGVLLEETADGATGEIITAGLFNKTVSGLTGVSVGQTIYISNTGALTNVKPTASTDLVQNIGVVLQTNGSNIQKMKVSAIDRVNDIPNLASGKFFIGGVSNQVSAYTLPTSDGSANQVLTTDGLGAVTFQDAASGGLSNVVEDTTPQLGGDLDVNGNAIKGSSVSILGATGELMITATENGPVALRYDNNLKLSTKSDGVNITGELEADSLDIDGNADISGTLNTHTIPSGTGTIALTSDITGIDDVVDDTTPQLGGDLDSNGNEIRFRDTGHTNYVAIAPSTLEPGSSVTYFLPIADGTSGQVIQTNGSGRLTFATRATEAYVDTAANTLTENTQTGTTYTTVLTDAGKMITCNNASAITVTIPPNSSVAYEAGTVLSFIQKGAGQVTLSAGAGVTLNNANGLKTASQYSVISCWKEDTDTWIVYGDTTA